MTSASELFYTRRSRAGRSSEPEPGLGLRPPSNRDPGHRQPHRRGGTRDRHHRRGEDCDSSRRFSAGIPPARHPCHHRVPRMEHESVWLDHGAASVLGTNNNSNGGSFSNRAERSRSLGNDRLPGTVALAQARLLERLRGISLTGRRGTPTGSALSLSEFLAGHDFNMSNLADRESQSPGVWSVLGIPYADLADDDADDDDDDDVYSLQNTHKKKPSGLSWEAIRSLRQEVFKDAEHGGDAMRALPECSICLDRFLEGDDLIRLSCGHKFHFACLVPWLRACGDCPYCRAII